MSSNIEDGNKQERDLKRWQIRALKWGIIISILTLTASIIFNFIQKSTIQSQEKNLKLKDSTLCNYQNKKEDCDSILLVNRRIYEENINSNINSYNVKIIKLNHEKDSLNSLIGEKNGMYTRLQFKYNNLVEDSIKNIAELKKLTGQMVIMQKNIDTLTEKEKKYQKEKENLETKIKEYRNLLDSIIPIQNVKITQYLKPGFDFSLIIGKRDTIQNNNAGIIGAFDVSFDFVKVNIDTINEDSTKKKLIMVSVRHNINETRICSCQKDYYIPLNQNKISLNFICRTGHYKKGIHKFEFFVENRGKVAEEYSELE